MTEPFPFAQFGGAPVRDAATVLALRDTEGGPQVFMVRRDSRLGFLGGAHVFPGGALDDADCRSELFAVATGFDRAGDLSRLHSDPVRARGLLLTAVRELFEESGILLAQNGDGEWADLDGDDPACERLRAGRAELAQHGGDFAALLAGEKLRIDVSGLRYFAHWITPEREKKRFDTRFFLARAPERQSARHCEIELVPPTIACLERLSGFADVDAALAKFVGADVPCILPKILLGDEIVILYPGDADYDSGEPQPLAGRPANRLVMRDGLWHRPS